MSIFIENFSFIHSIRELLFSRHESIESQKIRFNDDNNKKTTISSLPASHFSMANILRQQMKHHDWILAKRLCLIVKCNIIHYFWMLKLHWKVKVFRRMWARACMTYEKPIDELRYSNRRKMKKTMRGEKSDKWLNNI